MRYTTLLPYNVNVVCDLFLSLSLRVHICIYIYIYIHTYGTRYCIIPHHIISSPARRCIKHTISYYTIYYTILPYPINLHYQYISIHTINVSYIILCYIIASIYLSIYLSLSLSLYIYIYIYIYIYLSVYLSPARSPRCRGWRPRGRPARRPRTPDR